MSWFYYKFIYRHLMIFMHKHDWHHMQKNPYIEPGKILLWCHWCGVRSSYDCIKKKSLEK